MTPFRKFTGLWAERRELRPLVVILVMLIAGILVKLDKAWLALVAAALCLLLVCMRRDPQ
jgi:hypothetical protein